MKINIDDFNEILLYLKSRRRKDPKKPNLEEKMDFSKIINEMFAE